MANLLINDIDVMVDDKKLIDISSEHRLVKDRALSWLSKAIEQVGTNAVLGRDKDIANRFLKGKRKRIDSIRFSA